jgi:hypothetical protein
MKSFIMYKDQDFDIKRKLPSNEPALTQDLELNTLFNAMALDDKFLFEVAQKAILSTLKDLDTIRYRQNILKDCLKNPGIVRDIYDLAVDSIVGEKKHWRSWRDSPESLLHRSVQVLEMFVGALKRLRAIADEHSDKFESAGFARLFAMLKAELDEEYFATIQHHLRELAFRGGVLISAELSGLT